MSNSAALPTNINELQARTAAGEQFEHLLFWGHQPSRDGMRSMLFEQQATTYLPFLSLVNSANPSGSFAPAGVCSTATVESPR